MLKAVENPVHAMMRPMILTLIADNSCALRTSMPPLLRSTAP